MLCAVRNARINHASRTDIWNIRQSSEIGRGADAAHHVTPRSSHAHVHAHANTYTRACVLMTGAAHQPGHVYVHAQHVHV